MIPPTPQQAKCLDAIRRLTTAPGVPPSISELQHELGYVHRAGLHGLLVQMRERGLITWEPRRARTIQLVAREISRADLQALPDEQLKRVVSWGHSVMAERGLLGR